MQGVMVDLAIGAALFTPIGFLAAYLQHKKILKQEEKDKESTDKKSDIDINTSFQNKNFKT